MSDFTEATREEILAEIPDNGTLSRRLRRWNIRHGYVGTFLVWICVAVILVKVFT